MMPLIRGLGIVKYCSAEVNRDAIVSVGMALRDGPGFQFEQLMDLCGVDWPERAERFDVVYHLLSVSLNQRVRVIVTAAAETAVDSVHAVWPAATWRRVRPARS